MEEIIISTLIERVILIAKKFNDNDLLKWAYLESDGYFDSNEYLTEDVIVPKYRETPIEHRDQYERPLIITDPDLKDINVTRLRNSVTELEEFANNNGLLSCKDPTIINIIHKHLKVPVTHYIFNPKSIKSILHSIKLEAFKKVENYISLDDLICKSFKIKQKNEKKETIEKSIFLSYSFNKDDTELVKGFIDFLESSGFKVITGVKNPIGSLSKSILRKIQSAEKFVVVMTKRDKKENGKYTTSSWLLEEKGVAIAYYKPCLMLVENEIDNTEIGGMQGDDQRLHFTRNNFTSIVAEAIKMLKGNLK